MNLIGTEWSELSVLYLKTVTVYLTLFTLYHLQI